MHERYVNPHVCRMRANTKQLGGFNDGREERPWKIVDEEEGRMYAE